MRIIHSDKIRDAIKEMCIEANLVLSKDVEKRILAAEKEESSELGGKILSQLKENMEIAKAESIPICQDTGMAIIFLEIGQEQTTEYIMSEKCKDKEKCEIIITGRTKQFLSLVGEHLSQDNMNQAIEKPRGRRARIFCGSFGAERIRLFAPEKR